MVHQIVFSSANKSSQIYKIFDDLSLTSSKSHSNIWRRAYAHTRDVLPMLEEVNRANLAGMAEAQPFKLIEKLQVQYCNHFVKYS